MYRMVEFPSEGATLRGRFYYREDAPVPAPLVIMAHGTSATTTMAIDRYAEVLHAAGLCVLLYHHRTLGHARDAQHAGPLSCRSGRAARRGANSVYDRPSGRDAGR